MSVEESLQQAIQNAADGDESYFLSTFDTPSGKVNFFAQIVVEGNVVLCKDVATMRYAFRGFGLQAVVLPRQEKLWISGAG
ncbi:hypothetical protein GJ699_05415 [Duganella sp. FT80W]|uniref:Uncharacterized protein n=1 Tax=Duganella guangzhouensis TaxID=2666084 RepID=A0A6I2KTX7_9BURK|nr:hypothetical protein [Duganella guangzhouensis]MRW89415.1 hypothetical protein [Duganella guangzhouensis]